MAKKLLLSMAAAILNSHHGFRRADEAPPRNPAVIAEACEVFAQVKMLDFVDVVFASNGYLPQRNVPDEAYLTFLAALRFSVDGVWIPAATSGKSVFLPPDIRNVLIVRAGGTPGVRAEESAFEDRPFGDVEAPVRLIEADTGQQVFPFCVRRGGEVALLSDRAKRFHPGMIAKSCLKVLGGWKSYPKRNRAGEVDDGANGAPAVIVVKR